MTNIVNYMYRRLLTESEALVAWLLLLVMLYIVTFQDHDTTPSDSSITN